MTGEEFIEKVLLLQEQFHINVNIVATPQNLEVLKRIKDLMPDQAYQPACRPVR